MTLFSVTGKVIRGNRFGHQLGYPTANIEVTDEASYHPFTGVYAARVIMDTDVFGGMANIGFRPTLVSPSFTIEVHLFDFFGDLYGKTITIIFLHRIRDEMSLPGLPALRDQMKKDEVTVRHLLKSFNDPDTYSQ